MGNDRDRGESTVLFDQRPLLCIKAAYTVYIKQKRLCFFVAFEDCLLVFQLSVHVASLFFNHAVSAVKAVHESV